ncbi:unnamed protein product [Gongylonema pulchrum]|uniref:Uncharacterized protein n=1 Tax=Gongylonema pulchrum TaxID=637853 RepID=A0A3P6R3E7_9BILA|nr:unnamed protein product [Gongylonema pulchrum]
MQRTNCELPTSTVIVNEKKATRTIMHYRGKLQEPSLAELQAAFPDIGIFSWIHFEGRNFENLLSMIRFVHDQRKNQRPKISLECEKVRDFETLEDAIPFADVIFVSKDFARFISYRLGCYKTCFDRLYFHCRVLFRH